MNVTFCNARKTLFSVSGFPEDLRLFQDIHNRFINCVCNCLNCAWMPEANKTENSIPFDLLEQVFNMDIREQLKKLKENKNA